MSASEMLQYIMKIWLWLYS